MEPVFMVSSQSAATAACLAIDANTSVQNVDQAKLRARLLADGQILNPPSTPATASPPSFSASNRASIELSYSRIVWGMLPNACTT